MEPVVIFDLGGVLLPFNHRRRIGAMVDAFGLTSAEVMRFLSSGITEEWTEANAISTHQRQGCRRFAERPITAARAKELWLSVFEAPNMELWDLVAQLRGQTRTYALSDNPTFVSDVFPRTDAFDKVFWSAELGMTKPAREVFARVSQETKIAPANITFIDDSAANVEAAHAFGWDGIPFSSNDQLLVDLRTRGFQL
jgi:putative hydrolase of the HAD superfamily